MLQWVLPSSFHYIVGMSFDSLVIVITLIQLITLSDRKEWRWLETPLLRFFGKISYSLYLYHLPVIFTVTYLVARYHYRWRVALLSEFVFSIAFATLSYQLVERPFLRLKRGFERVGNKPGVSSLAIPFYGTRRQANTSPRGSNQNDWLVPAQSWVHAVGHLAVKHPAQKPKSRGLEPESDPDQFNSG